ncbi:hypothetical protein E3226_007160 [Legionella geestiana]|uniref:hypothetical protein n=1 Tax=Legionella geestiana TaxID=45065 RepID=UPI0010920055|nr:hypothetical protein [Legionella geestiana]QDQ40191.1 hypothetical protein E3226_007160 [Legionella geestiana]
MENRDINQSLTNTEDLPSTTQVVLFSGGRDSTLTASLLMMKNIPVYLLSANSGASVHRNITQFRIKELINKFGKNLLVGYKTLDISGTFRSIALENIEQDILTDKKNLVVVGEMLAIMVHVADFCLRSGLNTVNCGFTKYQEDFPEQRESSIEFIFNFLKKYHIHLACPIYQEATTIEFVKYKLLQIGLSNKPLEGSTLFSDTFSRADDQTILNYLKRKEIMTHEHIKFLTQNLFEHSI